MKRTMLLLGALVALGLEQAQDLLDLLQLLVGGIGKPVGVTHERGHVAPVLRLYGSDHKIICAYS